MNFLTGRIANADKSHPAQTVFFDANILVITARSLVKNSIARYLRQTGYQNVECLKGRGLIKETVASFSPDLIVLDDEISMTESLFNILVPAKTSGAKMKFILIVPSETKASDMEGEGFSALLLKKPFKADQLGLFVRRSLRDIDRLKVIPTSKLASLTSKLSQSFNQTFLGR